MVSAQDSPTKDPVAIVDLYFSSGNGIPVERATVKADEWRAVKAEVKRLREYEWMYKELRDE